MNDKYYARKMLIIIRLKPTIYRTIYINNNPTRYEVSNYGDIRNSKTNLIMRPTTDNKGYMRICLTINGKKITKKIHRLVAECFIHKKYSFQNQVNHKNRIRNDNYVCNLEWVTAKQNQEHSYLVGGPRKVKKGEKMFNAKHYEIDIIKVCELLERKFKSKVINEITGVNKHVINKIKEGKLWKHISKDFNIPSPRQKEIYSYKLKERIKELLILKHTSTQIINILDLEYSQPYYSLIFNIKNKMKKGKE